ncbi:MAG: DUF1116 domain-containing protein [Candidatus Brocadiae bacterium]|nr:DUF1116 domain-containing protein [Candidatus Brocadiia bacterium]
MIDIEKANAETTQRMIEAHPVLVGLGKAKDVIPGMEDNMLLHAGPPITWERACGTLKGAVIGALLWEGKAKTEQEAVQLMVEKKIKLSPCHHHQAVGPMAGIISPSMSVYIVENKTHGNRAFCNLNEGYGKVLRYGAFSQDVLDRLRWLEDVVAPVMKEAILETKGIDMRSLISEALHMGDEGHNRNKAGTLLFLKAISPAIAKVCKNSLTASQILDFTGNNALWVLNPIMASCKAIADSAMGIEGSTIVCTMARNGTDFGIRISGLGKEEWFTAPAQIPKGLYFSGFKAEDANPDIGDSTITETSGIGAFAMAAAPAIVTFVSGTPKDALNSTLEMYEITHGKHRFFTIPQLDFQGTPVGIDIRKVVEKGITPRVNTGIAHKNPGVGQIGAGLVRPPMEIFEQALFAFAKKYNFE